MVETDSRCCRISEKGHLLQPEEIWKNPLGEPKHTWRKCLGKGRRYPTFTYMWEVRSILECAGQLTKSRVVGARSERKKQEIKMVSRHAF